MLRTVTGQHLRLVFRRPLLHDLVPLLLIRPSRASFLFVCSFVRIILLVMQKRGLTIRSEGNTEVYV
jgi:hypothetical protein